MSETVHATAVLAGAEGVLIRGPSGSGKSALAAFLIQRGARLVADDRVHLSACHGRIIASVPALIRGKLELRGRGILDLPREANAVIRLVVDVMNDVEMERHPEPAALAAEVLGVTLPRQPVPCAPGRAVLLVEAALNVLRQARDTDLQSARV